MAVGSSPGHRVRATRLTHATRSAVTVSPSVLTFISTCAGASRRGLPRSEIGLAGWERFAAEVPATIARYQYPGTQAGRLGPKLMALPCVEALAASTRGHKQRVGHQALRVLRPGALPGAEGAVALLSGCRISHPS